MAVAALKATIRARQPAKAAFTTRIAARNMPLRSTAASRWFDGAARESLRQCESRELHKDTEGQTVYLMDYETFEDVTADLPPLHR